MSRDTMTADLWRIAWEAKNENLTCCHFEKNWG